MRGLFMIIAVLAAFALFSECNSGRKCVPEDEYDLCDEERESRQF